MTEARGRPRLFLEQDFRADKMLTGGGGACPSSGSQGQVLQCRAGRGFQSHTSSPTPARPCVWSWPLSRTSRPGSFAHTFKDEALQEL